MVSEPVVIVIKPRIDRLFAKYLRNGNPQLLTQVLDQAAPELWRVAAHLCATRHDAEDAVQSTFLAAIEDQSAWDPKRPLMPWLVGMLINRTREQRRKLNREVDPDRVSVAAPPDPAKLAGEREFGESFAKALRDVTEPYRSVVEQHLVRGIGATDIAAKTGVPAATIRTRLHRGLEQLRKRLPAGAGAMAIVPAHIPAESMTTVCTAVKNGARIKKGVAASTAIVAATAGFELKKVLLLAAATLIALTTWQLVDVETAEGSQNQQAGTLPPQQAPLTNEDNAAPTDNNLNVVAQTPASDRVAVSGAGDLHVLVRNGKTKQPLAGVQVVAQTQVDTRAQTQEPAGTATAAPSAMDAVDSVPSMAKGTTDAEGRVRLRIATGTVRVASTHGKPQLTFATVHPDIATEHVLDIAAALPADVRVVNEHGEPVPFATILGRTQGVHHEVELGTADAHGRWREDRTDREIYVRAATPDLAASAIALLTDHSPEATVTLTKKSAKIHGIVMDETGTAVPHATVLLASQLGVAASDLPITVKCDNRGRYNCTWLHEGSYQALVAQIVAGQVKRAMVFSAIAATGDCPETNLQLTRGASVVAQMRRPNSQPLINHTLQLEYIATDADRRFASQLMRHANTDNDGRCSLRNMMPGRYKLTARFHNASVEKDIELIEGGSFRFDHTFAPMVSLPIEIVDENAKPRAGVKVTLHTDDSRVGYKTDRSGKVRFNNLSSRRYEVTLSTNDAHGFTQARHTLSPSLEAVRLVLPRQLALGKVIGRFDLSSGPPPKGFGATLSRVSAPLLRPDGRVQVKVDEATGDFAVDQLLPGNYFLHATAQHVGVASRPNIEVTADSTTDVGAIRFGSGKIQIRVHGEVANPMVTGAQPAGVDLTILRPTEVKRIGDANHLALDDLCEGRYLAIVWGENTLRVALQATVVIGQTVQLSAQVVPGVRTELRLPDGMGIVELRMPNGTKHRELSFDTQWARGLAPGKHHVQYTGQDGNRFEAEFLVGTEPSTPVTLRRVPR